MSGGPSTLWQRLYFEASSEALRAAERPRALLSPFNSSHEGYAALAEEVDELREEVKGNNFEHAKAETVQVGAKALRFIADPRARRTRPTECALLAKRMREAADVILEADALCEFGAAMPWTASDLRREADVIETAETKAVES